MLLYIHKTRDRLSIVGNSCLCVAMDLLSVIYMIVITNLVLGSVYLYIVYLISCSVMGFYGLKATYEHYPPVEYIFGALHV